MLQHAAGRLPGVLVTLPGVHPAPNPTDKQADLQRAPDATYEVNEGESGSFPSGFSSTSHKDI